jgi:hypothetical protein
VARSTSTTTAPGVKLYTHHSDQYGPYHTTTWLTGCCITRPTSRSPSTTQIPRHSVTWNEKNVMTTVRHGDRRAAEDLKPSMAGTAKRCGLPNRPSRGKKRSVHDLSRRELTVSTPRSRHEIQRSASCWRHQCRGVVMGSNLSSDGRHPDLPMSGSPRTGSFLNILAERAVVAQGVTCERTR